jgi:uncharacterized protein (DUF4415 family)
MRRRLSRFCQCTLSEPDPEPKSDRLLVKQTSSSKTQATSDDDAPALSQADFDRARLRVGGKDVNRAEWQAAVRARVRKQRINIMLDTPIVEHFKSLAGERGYQTLINDTLRRVIESEHLEADLRRIIREELRSADQ